MSTDLPALVARWADDYLFGYARDRWIAIRRDGLTFIPADTLTQLETEIESDYQKNPVLYECDPLDAARDYLTADHGSEPECTDPLSLAVHAAEAIREAVEDLVILHDLRVLFPDWDIEYSQQMREWIAKRKGTGHLGELATVHTHSPHQDRAEMEARRKRHPPGLNLNPPVN